MNGKPGTSIFHTVVVFLHAHTWSDTLKGSYYANPVVDDPEVPQHLRGAYPEYYGKNICTHYF